MHQAIKVKLNEQQRRLFLGAYASAIGKCGVSIIAKLASASRDTVSRGVREVAHQEKLSEKIRHKGGGRKKKKDINPKIILDLQSLVEAETRGDPMSVLLWTNKSTRKVAEGLKALGHKVSDRWVAKELKNLGYSLQGNAKVFEGKQHEDRDEQFLYIHEQIKVYDTAGQPVISVDTKKKELIGNFKNQGQTYRPTGSPVKVNAYDFATFSIGKAVPYGIYDLSKNKGFVNIGNNHDTAAFAVASILLWWEQVGKYDYPNTTRLLIVADGGGSNGSRVRAWKVELVKFCQTTGLEVTVCHLPPATSKWNRIEHKMFSYISMNWKGRPLVSFDVIKELISHTTTKTGLVIKAVLDKTIYPLGIRYSKEQVNMLPMKRHDFHPEWNYTIYPKVFKVPPLNA